MRYKIILSVVLLVLVQLFIFQNMEIVQIRFLFWTLTISRVFLMFSMLITGIFIGWLVNSYLHHHRKKQNP